MVPSARFDDLTAGREQSFELLDHVSTITAHSLDQVVPALRTVTEASARGLWSAGYVAYEAAPAFSGDLEVRRRRLGESMPDLPLVWFATFERRQSAAPFQPRVSFPAGYTVSGWAPDITADDWHRAIAEIHDRIAAGDADQVNHTFRLRAAFSGDPWELYRDLALAQRGAHSTWLDTGRYQIASASPELFFRLGGGAITTRPMKGTIHRGRWPAEDRALAERLIASEKERTENLMIVELLGRELQGIGESVETNNVLKLEQYETLWTLTSEVSATVDPTTRLEDVFGALFPAGSITGTPKPETMRMIADLERNPRGVYCGAVGYVPPAGSSVDAHFNVAIRTVVIDSEEGIAEYGVGGGITADSDSASEYEEARTKARLLVERRPEFDLVESMRWDPRDGFILIDRHIARLAASAAYFGYVTDTDDVRELLEKTVSALDVPMRISLRMNRYGAVTVEIDERLIDPFFEWPQGMRPMRLAIGEPRIDTSDVFLYHKTTSRIVYENQRDDHPFAEDVALVNRDLNVTEATTANIVVRFGDTWWTPDVGSGCLPGVYRGALLESGRIAERTIPRGDLLGADEIALVDSVRGWRSASIVADSTG